MKHHFELLNSETPLSTVESGNTHLGQSNRKHIVFFSNMYIMCSHVVIVAIYGDRVNLSTCVNSPFLLASQNNSSSIGIGSETRNSTNSVIHLFFT